MVSLKSLENVAGRSASNQELEAPGGHLPPTLRLHSPRFAPVSAGFTLHYSIVCLQQLSLLSFDSSLFFYSALGTFVF